MRITILCILLLLPVLAFSQANRVKQIRDNTGVFRGSVAPTDTSLTWRNTTDGQSYFWDSGASAWNIVQFNYQVDSVGQISATSYPTGARIDSKGYYEYGDGGDATYYVYDSKTGYENVDTLGGVWETANSKFAIIDTRKPLNVFAFGVDRTATVSGATDTEAMQRIFDYCAKTDFEEVIEINQRCTIDLDSTIRYDGTQNTKGLRIRGMGRSRGGLTATTFFWRGASNDTMFLFEQITNLHIQGVDINGNGVADILLRFDPLSNAIYIDDCNLGNTNATPSAYAAAIDTETSGTQVSEIHVTRCRIAGTGYGFKGGISNNKDFYFQYNNFIGNDTSIHVGATGALYVGSNTFSGGAVSVSIPSGANGAIIEANEVEGDTLFIYAGGASDTYKNVNVNGNLVSLAAGNKFPIIGEGRLNMIGNDFIQNDSTAVQIKWGDGNHDAIYSVGNKFFFSTWDKTDLDTFPFIDLGGNIYNGPIVSRNDFGGARGTAGEKFPYWEKNTDQDITIDFGGTNVVIESSQPAVDSIKLLAKIQTGLELILGSTTSEQTITFTHGPSGDAMVFQSSNVSFVNKNLLATFGVGIRGGGPKVKGIDNSNVDGSSGFGIYNNSVEGLTIDNAGNVGVKSIDPTEAIQVNGNAVIDGTVFLNTSKDVGIFRGTGSPESVVIANVGSIFLRTDGGTGTTLYVKESGAGNTGWVAK